MLQTIISLLTNMWGFLCIFCICATVITIFLTIYKNKDGSETSITKEGLKITKGNKKIEDKPSPHSTCPHARDIMEIVQRTVEFSEKRLELKNSIIEEQMKFYDEIEEEMKSKLEETFKKLISSKLKNETSFITNEEYKSYIITLRVIFSELKVYVKSFYKSNHYAFMTPTDQAEYIEKKKFLIIQKLESLINSYWIGNLVPVDIVYIANQNIKRDIEALVGEAFNRAFLISRETYKRIENLENDYYGYISKTVGDPCKEVKL